MNQYGVFGSVVSVKRSAGYVKPRGAKIVSVSFLGWMWQNTTVFARFRTEAVRI